MNKVGQIWQYEEIGRYCVTNIQEIDYETVDECIIWQDGSVDTLKRQLKRFKTYGKLIAEYPTWQEAVNSKEFKVG